MKSCSRTQPLQVSSLFAAIRAEFGRLDITFNNAGVSLRATNFGELCAQDWDKV